MKYYRTMNVCFCRNSMNIQSSCGRTAECRPVTNAPTSISSLIVQNSEYCISWFTEASTALLRYVLDCTRWGNVSTVWHVSSLLQLYWNEHCIFIYYTSLNAVFVLHCHDKAFPSDDINTAFCSTEVNTALYKHFDTAYLYKSMSTAFQDTVDTDNRVLCTTVSFNTAM